MENSKLGAAIIGICILLGLSSLGILLGSAAIEFKEYERSVVVIINQELNIFLRG